MTTAAFPERLRSLLVEREVHEATLALALGLSKSAMSRRMNGAMEFRLAELRSIADFLEVPLEQLLAPAEAAS